MAGQPGSDITSPFQMRDISFLPQKQKENVHQKSQGYESYTKKVFRAECYFPPFHEILMTNQPTD